MSGHPYAIKDKNGGNPWEPEEPPRSVALAATSTALIFGGAGGSSRFTLRRPHSDNTTALAVAAWRFLFSFRHLLPSMMMLDFWTSLFDGGNFMPHGHCYLWLPGLIRLHVLTDLAIGLAYVAISFTLVYLVSKAKKDMPFSWLLACFGLF